MRAPQPQPKDTHTVDKTFDLEKERKKEWLFSTVDKKFDKVSREIDMLLRQFPKEERAGLIDKVLAGTEEKCLHN